MLKIKQTKILKKHTKKYYTHETSQLVSFPSSI